MAHLINVLGPNFLKLTQQQLAGPSVNWYYMDTTALPTEQGDYMGSLSHLIFKDDSGPVSSLFDTAFAVLCAALDAEGQQLSQLYRIRLGMITRTPYRVTHDPHIDDGRPHRTGLFYVIDSDGDTLIYNERSESAKYTVQESVAPVVNSWHTFDGAHFHSSQSPIKHDKRIVLTYNYTVA